MRVINNVEKRAVITCDCGASLEIGIMDIKTKQGFLAILDKYYIHCPICNHKQYLRSDIKRVIANS